MSVSPEFGLWTIVAWFAPGALLLWVLDRLTEWATIPYPLRLGGEPLDVLIFAVLSGILGALVFGVIEIGRRALRGRSPIGVAGGPAAAARPGASAMYVFQATLAGIFFLVLSLSITIIWRHWDDMNANGTAAMSIAIAGIAAFGLVVASMRARAAGRAWNEFARHAGTGH